MEYVFNKLKYLGCRADLLFLLFEIAVRESRYGRWIVVTVHSSSTSSTNKIVSRLYLNSVL